jgi:hypothetical protein
MCTTRTRTSSACGTKVTETWICVRFSTFQTGPLVITVDNLSCFSHILSLSTGNRRHWHRGIARRNAWRYEANITVPHNIIRRGRGGGSGSHGGEGGLAGVRSVQHFVAVLLAGMCRRVMCMTVHYGLQVMRRRVSMMYSTC